MRLSHQIQYAICGVFDIAYNGGGSPVQVRIIGDRQDIPQRYLEQIFQRLRKANLVSGKRGPGGGYVLARPASEITLRDVVEAVEGPIADSRFAGSDRRPSPFRPDFLWSRLSEEFATVLAGITVEAMCREAARTAVTRFNVEEFTYQI